MPDAPARCHRCARPRATEAERDAAQESARLTMENFNIYRQTLADLLAGVSDDIEVGEEDRVRLLLGRCDAAESRAAAWAVRADVLEGHLRDAVTVPAPLVGPHAHDEAGEVCAWCEAVFEWKRKRQAARAALARLAALAPPAEEAEALLLCRRAVEAEVATNDHECTDDCPLVEKRDKGRWPCATFKDLSFAACDAHRVAVAALEKLKEADNATP